MQPEDVRSDWNLEEEEADEATKQGDEEDEQPRFYNLFKIEDKHDLFGVWREINKPL